MVLHVKRRYLRSSLGNFCSIILFPNTIILSKQYIYEYLIRNRKMADELEQTRCGKFGYENISGHAYAIPYILRNNEKLCASKIFEWHFDKHKHSLKPSLVNFGYLKGYEMHREEACLIDEINGWHNNNMYGRLSETLVKMDDVRNIFKYVNDCTKKRKEGDKFTMIAGMARIRLSLDRDDIILPYISKNGQRYVPIHSLNPLPSGLVVTTLTDIDVMYIRYLFDVLKIPLPHQKFEMPCVSLDQLIAQLSKNAGGYYDYDDKHWPTKEIPAKLNNNDLPFFSITTNNNYSQEKVNFGQINRIHFQGDKCIFCLAIGTHC